MPRAFPANWRNDAHAKVTGRTKYTDDLKFPRLLHAVPVYADEVHARLRAVETAAAAAAPGVVRVLTARDVPGANRVGQIIADFRIFADDKIRYHGDVVAVVVAETRDQAIHAGRLVRVDASPLTAVLDPEVALRDEVLVHEERGTNLINTHRVRRGDPEAGFREAAFVIEHDFRTPFIEHAYLEPEVAVAVPRPDGVIEIHGSMQHPFSTRRFVAACLGCPLPQVEVVGTPMGGGFGGKDDTAAIVCARTALAARLLGRPVKTMYQRGWSIRESYKRHPYRVHYRMGVSAAGLITAVECRIVADGGAYCSVTPWVTWRSTVQCCGPYVVPHVHCDTLGVYTNNVVTGAMRGFGSPQMNFVVEQMVEIAAARAGLSGIEFRRRNMVRQGSVTITGQRLDNHTVSMAEVLEAVLKEIDYERKLSRCSHGHSDAAEFYGIGLAISYRGVSLGAEGVDLCAAILNVQADGTVVLDVGVHENGQGAESAMVILCAGELGLEPDQVRCQRASTSTIPDSGTTVASRGTIMGGGAVVLAARELKRKLAAAVAETLRCAPAEVRFGDGRLHGAAGASLSFLEAVQAVWRRRERPHACAVFRAPSVSWDEETGQGDAYFTWVYGCQAVELAVHKQTGKVRLLGAVAAHDVGRAINPGMVAGQFYGGMVMGLGYALHEEVKLKDGRITNTNLNTYRLPRATDVPEMTALIIENPDPASPSGAKSIGEPTNEIMAPAVANALFHATGRRHFSLPMRPAPPWPEPASTEGAP
jgi:CO/xanthine dehydrogenase Mo-binding subunit